MLANHRFGGVFVTYTVLAPRDLRLMVPMRVGPRCRVCGCTENNACEGDLGGCYWVEPDLCSGCAPDDHSGLIRLKGGIIVR